MRVLLSGGAGFIGSHVAKALLGRHHEVAIVDDLSSGKRENIPEGVHLYEMDIRSGCEELFEDFEPEALCHQATHLHREGRETARLLAQVLQQGSLDPQLPLVPRQSEQVRERLGRLAQGAVETGRGRDAKAVLLERFVRRGWFANRPTQRRPDAVCIERTR
jgi:NAD(P)-dependent dehydrogenase (short-subunit alcohol dehydrogenase family)